MRQAPAYLSPLSREACVLNPESPGVSAEPPHAPPRIDRGYVDTPFGQIHFHRSGTRGPLLFLFHETALSGREYLRALPLLGEHCRAVAFDTPGYGMSDPPPAPLSMNGIAERLHAAIRCFGEGPCILAGVHTGSSIALELAVDRLAERTTHLVLSGLALLTPDEVDRYRKIIAIPVLDREGRFLVDEWQKRLQSWGEVASLADVLWGTVEQLSVFERFHWALDAVFAHDAAGCLPRITMPTLFLVGAHDSFVEKDRRAAMLVRAAKLEVLEGCGGRLPWFEPTVYAHSLLRFAGLS